MSSTVRSVCYGPYMKSERYEMRMAEELLAAIDSQRGQLSRAVWITKVLEKAIREMDSVKSSVTAGTSSPSRASAARQAPPRVSARELQGTPLPKIAPRRPPR